MHEMTKGELLKLLEGFSDDQKILVEGYESGFDSIHEVRQESVARLPNAYEYNGQYEKTEIIKKHMDERDTSPMSRIEDDHFEGAGNPESVIVLIGRRGHRRF